MSDARTPAVSTGLPRRRPATYPSGIPISSASSSARTDSSTVAANRDVNTSKASVPGATPVDCPKLPWNTRPR